MIKFLIYKQIKAEIANRHHRHPAALTLMELVVAISLLALIALVATKVFAKVTEVQERNRDLQNIEGDLRYAVGVFNDEVKGATLQADNGCGTCSGKYFCVSLAGVLYLRDKNNVCVTYGLNGSALRVNRGGTNYDITSNDITVSVLTFVVSGATNDRVLVQLRATGDSQYNKTINYQTALTSTSLN